MRKTPLFNHIYLSSPQSSARRHKSRKCSHSFNVPISGQSTRYIPADKSGSSFANVIVGMTCEGSHESVFCVLGTAVLVSAVSDAAYLQAVSCCRFCRFPALSHHCTEPRQRSDKRQATNSVLTHLHGPVLSRNQGGLKKSSNRIF